MRKYCILLMLCMAFSITPAQANERSKELIHAFQVMCTTEPISILRMEAKEKAMRVPVYRNIKAPPDPSGYYMHSETWIMTLNSVPHQLNVTEGRGPKGYVKVCGISAADADATDFKAELTKTIPLQNPHDGRSPDGKMHMVVWPYATNVKLAFADALPGPGIDLSLIDLRQKK